MLFPIMVITLSPALPVAQRSRSGIIATGWLSSVQVVPRKKPVRRRVANLAGGSKLAS